MPGHPRGAYKAKIGCMKALQTKWTKPQCRPKAVVLAVPVATAPPSDEALGAEAVSPKMYEQAGLFATIVLRIGLKGHAISEKMS